MGEPVKYMFDAEFDPASEPETDILEETVAALNAEHAAALEAARAEAHAAGYEDGRQAALETVDAEIREALKHILDSTVTLARAVHADATAIKEFALRLAVATAEKLAGELIHRFPTGEIEALLSTCLRSIPTQAQVVVRVAPDMVETLRQRVEDIAASCGYAGMVSLHGNPDIQTADCRIEWVDGGMERNRANLIAEIHQALDSYFNSPQGGESQFSPLPENFGVTQNENNPSIEDGGSQDTTNGLPRNDHHDRQDPVNHGPLPAAGEAK